MKINAHINLARLIGKVDNDFNISESDWIPRAAAWTIDALSQMKVLPMEHKRRKLEVVERIAQFPCTMNTSEIRVFDKYGNEVKPHKTGDAFNAIDEGKEIQVIDNNNTSGVNFMHSVPIITPCTHSFIVYDNKIEVNFETDEIEVDSLEVVTYFDEYYNCECPYIYDDGLLLEALSWYIMFKYLSRGSTHPVYSIKANNAVTNPFIQWNNLRPKAAASVRIKISNTSDGWRNFFYNSTFTPRD